MSWKTNTRQLINSVSHRLGTVEKTLLQITCKHELQAISCLGAERASLYCTKCNTVIKVGTYSECEALRKDHDIEFAKVKMDDAIKAYNDLVV